MKMQQKGFEEVKDELKGQVDEIELPEVLAKYLSGIK